MRSVKVKKSFSENMMDIDFIARRSIHIMIGNSVFKDVSIEEAVNKAVGDIPLNLSPGSEDVADILKEMKFRNKLESPKPSRDEIITFERIIKFLDKWALEVRSKVFELIPEIYDEVKSKYPFESYHYEY